jgi:hypothetical protein
VSRLDQEELNQLGKGGNTMRVKYTISIRTDRDDWELIDQKFDTFDDAWEQAKRLANERIDSTRVLTVIIQKSMQRG